MEIQTQLDGFLVSAQNMVDDHYIKNGFAPLQGCKLITISGSKYIKIVAKTIHNGQLQEDSGSAWAFIDKTTGEIFKPASSKIPAKHARGSIMSEDFGLSCLTPYGPKYL